MNLPPAKRVVLAIVGAIAGMAIAHLVPRLLAQAPATATVSKVLGGHGF